MEGGGNAQYWGITRKGGDGQRRVGEGEGERKEERKITVKQ